MALVRVTQPVDYVLFEGSQPSDVSEPDVETKKNWYKYFEFTVLVTHWVGIIFLVLDGYFFGTTQGGFQWTTESDFNAMPPPPPPLLPRHSHGLLNLHGFFMTSAFIFFQGEAIIVYRVYRHELKIFSKTLHVLLHLAALASSSFGLAAMVRNKRDGNDVNLYSFHSWLGVLVFASYIIQFILGFVNYAYPKTSLEVRRWFMPIHRIFGSLVFVMSIITVMVGHQRFACFSFNEDPTKGCDRTHTCVKRLDLVLNFSTVFLLIYSILVCIIVRVDEWRRLETPDEKAHKE